MTLTALTWYGGKKTRHRWIREHLPRSHKQQMYVEPFSGMLSVLLNREEAGIEIVNDANSRVVNFWRVVREQPEELHRLLRDTPWSKDEFSACIDRIDEGSDLEMAWRFSTVCLQSILCGDNVDATSWHWHTYLRSTDCQHLTRDPQGFLNLANRIRNVQLENSDACKIIRRAAAKASRWDVVMYVDPPYQNTDVSPYSESVDYDELDAALSDAAAAGCRIACSGYRDNFSSMGWRKTSRKDFALIPKSEREEILWMSYDPEAGSLLDLCA